MIEPGFDGYLSLKKEYAFIKRGIDFSHVLAVQLIQVAYKSAKLDWPSLWHTARLLFKTLDLTALKDAFTADVVSSYVINRADYTDQLNGYFAKVPGCQRVYLPSLPYKTKLSPVNILRVFFFILFKKHSGNIRQKVYIACYFIHYLNIADTLEQTFVHLNTEGKKYIPFNSSFDIETLLTQFFRDKKVDTFHISHGISYVKYNNHTGFDTVNGENITAKNILVWGDTSKAALVNRYGRDAGAITVAGNPKYPHKAINVKQGFNKGIIFLGAVIYDNDNLALIALAARLQTSYAIKFTAKPHPASNLEALSIVAGDIQILPKEKSITEILQAGEYDFAITYNSTAYWEAMYYDRVCLRYAVNENGIFDGLDDKFFDEPSFGERVAHFKACNPLELNKQIEELLTANLGMGINKYEKIFNN